MSVWLTLVVLDFLLLVVVVILHISAGVEHGFGLS